jgi:hypothetical protein
MGKIVGDYGEVKDGQGLIELLWKAAVLGGVVLLLGAVFGGC